MLPLLLTTQPRLLAPQALLLLVRDSSKDVTCDNCMFRLSHSCTGSGIPLNPTIHSVNSQRLLLSIQALLTRLVSVVSAHLLLAKTALHLPQPWLPELLLQLRAPLQPQPSPATSLWLPPLQKLMQQLRAPRKTEEHSPD